LHRRSRAANPVGTTFKMGEFVDPPCSKCGKDATVTLHVIVSGVELPPLELCDECYAKFPLPPPGIEDLQIGVSHRRGSVDRREGPERTPNQEL
jgi:hypothetical protein